MVFKLPSSRSSLSRGGLLQNRWVLYFVFAVALACLFFFAATGSLISLIVFALVGFITHFFNKNMTVVLTTAIATTAVVHFLLFNGGRNDISAFLKQEGFESVDEVPPEEAVEKDPSEADDTEESMVAPTRKPVRKPAAPATTPAPTSEPEEEAAVAAAAPENIDKELEKLRLQKQVLDKLKNLEPFLSKMSGA
jgi:hypothetical protein